MACLAPRALAVVVGMVCILGGQGLVRPAPGVRDPVLAYLVGLLWEDSLDTLTGTQIMERAPKTGSRTLIPVHLLASMGRGPGHGHQDRVVTLWLVRPSKVPAPYSLLGYHPGSVRIPQRVVMDEWRLGPVTVVERRGTFTLEDCYVWALREGRVSIDVDAVVDRVLGPAVDDTRVTTMALFRLDGALYAMAMGYNDQGEGRSGALDLAKNELVYPTSWKLKAAARILRRKAEVLSQAFGAAGSR